MTLVLARINKGRIAIVADTIVTEHDKQLSPQMGLLKSWIFPGNICVSFCNSPELAEADFKQFLAMQIAKGPAGENGLRCSYEETVEFFEDSSKTTGNDYIIAFDAPPKLVKIVGGRRTPTLSNTAWIGDHNAYAAFREHEAKLRPKSEKGRAINAVIFADEPTGSPASDIYSIFRNVIADRSISTVGGFGCVISSRGNGFRFSVYSDMLFDWPSADLEYELSYNDKVDLIASGENAGYAVAQISPSYIGTNCVAFYFPKSMSLFVYYSDHPNGLATICTTFRAIQPNDIKNTLDRLFQADLGWLALVTSAPDLSISPSLNRNAADAKNGLGASFFVNANTFPKNNSKL